MACDYVYKAQGDTVRLRIFKRENGWDFDVFDREKGYLFAYTSEAACGPFARKRDAKGRATADYGPLTSINPDSVTDGWD